MRKGILRYSILIFFLVLYSVFSVRHFILGGGVAASVDALCPFGGFETLYTFIATGGFVPRILMSSLVLAVGVLLTAIVLRRGFCGYICPFGTVQELLGKLSRRKMAVPKAIDRNARYIKYGMLAAILIGTALTGTLVFREYDPFITFFHFGKGLLWGEEEAVSLVPIGITIAVLSASIIIHRFWCRYLCPLGAMLSLASLIGLSKIERGKTCNGCKACDRSCPMGVIVSDVKAVKDPECINCNICVDTCPKGSLTVNVVRWKVPLYAYAMLVVGLFFLAIGVAKATGVWQSVPPVSLTDASGNLDATSIKGWMTLDDVSKETGISVSEMIVALDLPSGMDTSVPLRIGSKYGIVFETEDLREFVANYEMTTSLPEQSCPWGIEDDPYPGRCGLYDDKDGNGACDLSE